MATIILYFKRLAGVAQHGFLHHLRNSAHATGTVTKRVIQVSSPEDIPRAVAEAVRIATAGRPGPVHLEVPMDILDDPFVYRDVFIHH